MTDNQTISIATIIAHVESGGNKYAMRYEPSTHNQIENNPKHWQLIVNKIQKANTCSLETARAIAATSFGKYQVMGFNLYQNYRLPVGAFFNSDADQDAAFAHFLISSNLENYTVADLKDKTKRDHFARIYNGPGNVADYSLKLLDVLTIFTVPVE
jgi:hypothetical protein